MSTVDTALKITGAAVLCVLIIALVICIRRRRRQIQAQLLNDAQQQQPDSCRTTTRFDSPPLYQQPEISFRPQSMQQAYTIGASPRSENANTIYPTAPPSESPEFSRRY